MDLVVDRQPDQHLGGALVMDLQGLGWALEVERKRAQHLEVALVVDRQRAQQWS